MTTVTVSERAAKAVSDYLQEADRRSYALMQMGGSNAVISRLTQAFAKFEAETREECAAVAEGAYSEGSESRWAGEYIAKLIRQKGQP